MSLVQKIKGNYKTFKEVAETLFHKAMSKNGPCKGKSCIWCLEPEINKKMLKGETEVNL